MARGMARLVPGLPGLRVARGMLALWTATALTLAATQAAAAGPRLADPRPGDGRAERTVSEWLARMHDASRQRFLNNDRVAVVADQGDVGPHLLQRQRQRRAHETQAHDADGGHQC